MGTAIYTRVSTTEQVNNGHGLQVQHEQCLAFAEFKQWEITHEFSDEGISGDIKKKPGTPALEIARRKRPGLDALLTAIDNGEVDHLIVAALDRLARSLMVMLELKEYLDYKKVTFASCKETIDTSTPTGIAMMQMIAMFAEWEKNTNVQRMTDGRNAHERLTGERGGPLPLGYVRDETAPNGITVDRQEAEIVRVIFQMRADGAILQKIADYLNDEMQVTSKQGGKWWPSTVKQILSQEETYRGGLRGHSPVYWPKILEG